VLFLSTSRVYPVPLLNSVRLREAETRFEIDPDQVLPGVSREGISESFPLEGTRTLYGTTKLSSEMLLQEYAEAFGLRIIVNRCGVIAGPWQMGKVDQGVFTHWMAAARFQKPLTYIGWGGAGKQVRDLLHIDDLGDLVERQMIDFDRLAGRVFNVGGGNFSSLSLLETTRLCETVTGRSLHVASSREDRPGDVRLYVTDNTRVTEATGWRPTRGPERILRDIHQWMVANDHLVRNVFS
jgi:CDP-paratose 2-epimerase